MDGKEGQQKKKADMHVGVQGMGTSPKELQFFVRYGVTRGLGFSIHGAVALDQRS